jgi:hypothetical protein
MVNFDNFDTTIDKLDNNTLRDFHKKLLENGCYQGLLNISEIDETDINKLRGIVKIGVQGAGYEKIRDIGPECIKKEIASINNTPVVVPQEPDNEPSESSETPEPNEDTGISIYKVPPQTPSSKTPETIDTKEKLIQELIHIIGLRKPGIGVPAAYIKRYGEILTLLNEKHAMTHLDIQKVTNISNKAVGKAIAQYKKDHPIIRPDDRVVTKAETKVADKLTAKVTEEADERIEDDMELAIHIRQTWLKEAYMRGISLRELIDTAIPIWLDLPDIYNMVLATERENAHLKEYIKLLELQYSSMTIRNRELNGTIYKMI